MKTNQLEELITESIALEQNAAALYEIFAISLPDDHDFWWQLRIEEKSHANLIRSARDSFVKRGKFPFEILANSIEELRQANAKTKGLIGHFTANPPSRREACEVAIELEYEAGETHFTQFMERDAITPVETVFQQLNRDDKDHKKRIREHLESLPAEA